MFGIRQKILLGFAGILAIASIVAVLSVLHFRELGEAIDVILRENFRSVVAAQDMKECLERIDSASLYSLAGLPERGQEQVREFEPQFHEALQVQLGNITLPGEEERARHIEARFADYELALDRLFAATDLTERREIYFSTLLPLFLDIKNSATEILQLNQANMHEASEAARQRASAATRSVILFLVCSAIIAIVFTIFSNHWILRPLEALNASAAEIARGNLDLYVTAQSRDEIGQLAATFNEMATSLRRLRRNDQQQVVHSQLAAEEVFRNFPAAVVMADLHGRIRFITPAAEQHFKLHAGGWLEGQTDGWMKSLHERALHEDRPIELPEEKLIQRFEEGQEHFFQPIAIPTHNPSRQQTGVLIHFRDVTQQCAQEELKRGVISTVSHQLKTPLTSIRMALHLLLDERVGALNAKQEELLLAAREDSDRLGHILEELLNIGRLRAGKDSLNPQPVAVTRIVHDAMEEFTAAARDKGLRLSVELPEDLPRVLVDQDRIAHVFGNLLSNAIKYTSAGGQVILSAQAAQDASVLFSVSDTGEGIPEEAQSRIFDQFFRVPGQERSSGAGLGLAIAREIVLAHGGSIGVESDPGNGSRFWFTLPAQDEMTGGRDKQEEKQGPC